jgi:hypothetical protein
MRRVRGVVHGPAAGLTAPQKGGRSAARRPSIGVLRPGSSSPIHQVRGTGILGSSGGGARLCAPVARPSPPYRGALYTPTFSPNASSYHSEASFNSWCQNSCERPSSMSTSRAKYSGWPHLPLIVPVSPRYSGRSPDSPTRTLTPMRACSGLTSLAPLPPLSANRLPEWQVDLHHRLLPQAIVVEFVEKVRYLALLVQPA